MKEFIIKEEFPEKDDAAFRNLVVLDLICFPDDDRFIPRSTEYCFIAYDKDKPIGFCVMRHFSKVKKIKTMKLTRAGVLEKYRGNGLQRILIDQRIQKGIELGYNRFISTTFDNPYSANNLISLGFRMYEPKSNSIFISGTNFWELKV